MTVAQLPFVRAAKLNLPSWCSKVVWKVDTYGAAAQLGFPQLHEEKVHTTSDLHALASNKTVGMCLFLQQVRTTAQCNFTLSLFVSDCCVCVCVWCAL